MKAKNVENVKKTFAENDKKTFRKQKRPWTGEIQFWHARATAVENVLKTFWKRKKNVQTWGGAYAEAENVKKTIAEND